MSSRVLLVVLFLAGCQPAGGFAVIGPRPTPTNKQGTAQVSAVERVLFLEHLVEESGRQIVGKYDKFFSYDSLIYKWDEDNQTLENMGREHETLVEGVRILYGNGRRLSGDYGSGTGNGLWTIFSTPYTPEWTGVELQRLDADGTVSLRYESQNYVLKAGQKLQRRYYSLRRDKNSLLLIITTEWFENHGFLRPDQIIGIPIKNKLGD